MPKILVTGGAGYIGSITTHHLLRRGFDVIVVDDLSRGHRKNIAPERLHVLRLQETGALAKLLDGVDAAQPTPSGSEGPRPGKAPTLNINDLKDMSIQKLTQVAKDLNVAGATGLADVVEHKRGGKKIAWKMKRRKGYHRKVGHRQELTVVRIKEIKL